MERAIYFDMDGTIADLYGVSNWLQELRAASCKPYEAAAPLLRLSQLARRLNQLQRNGWKIGVVSWTAKNSTTSFSENVSVAKRNWLEKHLHSVKWDEIHIVEYGTPKHKVVDCPNGILFDDEEGNRTSWTGTAYDEKNILEILKAVA